MKRGEPQRGPTTVRVLREVSERMYRAGRINHRFGDGASPRQRQIREAVEALGMMHLPYCTMPTPRIFFGCELHPGAINELICLDSATENRGHSANVISRLWRQRWLSKRIQSADVLNGVAQGNQSLMDFFSESVPADGDH